MSKPIVLTALLLQFSVAVFAQQNLLQTFEGKRIEVNITALRSNFQHSTVFQFSTQKLSEFVHRENVSSFRLNLGGDKDWEIDLQPSSLTASNYHLKILSPQGIQTISSRPDFLFKGKVRGSSKDEEVRLSIKDGFIYGSIQAGGKEYFIEPLNRFINTRQKDEYLIYEAKDVVATESFACGFKDKENSIKEAESQNNLREHSPQDAICKKIKFISVADYSIYQKFGENLYAVETALLSNLNLAEGAFTTLNLGADGSTDVGTDRLQLEMEEIVVSSCKECDIISGKESSPDLGQELSAWLQKFYPDKGNSILQFWTTRTLFSLDGLFIGGVSYSTIDCAGPPTRQILKYHSDDPGFLRMLIAHETGHLLGCRHDDQVKADVKGFIMQTSIANPTLATRFSTLADFGGVNYSSQKTIHDFINFKNCLPDCQVTYCEPVKDLKITYFNSADSIRLSWSGSGTFHVQYKILDSVNFDSANTHEITGNNITLKKLKPCNLYLVEVQKKCSDSSYGQVTSVVLNTSSLTTTANPINIHGDKYDLELNLNCRNCNSNEYVIKIDNHPF